MTDHLTHLPQDIAPPAVADPLGHLNGISAVEELKHATAPEVLSILRQIEVALSDAKGLGRNQDWVTTLEAREWLRQTLHPYMLEVAPLAAPKASTFRAWLDGLEEEWRDLDINGNAILYELGPTGPIPQPFIDQYFLAIQFRTLQTPVELARVTQTLSEVFTEGEEPTLLTLKRLEAELTTASKRLVWISEVLDENVNRVHRLQDLINARGVKPAPERRAHPAQTSNPATIGDMT